MGPQFVSGLMRELGYCRWVAENHGVWTMIKYTRLRWIAKESGADQVEILDHAQKGILKNNLNSFLTAAA